MVVPQRPSDIIEDFPCLVAVLDSVPEGEEREMLRGFLGGLVAAESVAAILRNHGHRVSASTIRTYRRALRRAQKGGRGQ